MIQDLSMLSAAAVVPLLFAVWLATGHYKKLFSVSGPVSNLLAVLSITAILSFSLIAGPWVFGSYWLRPVVAVLLILGLLRVVLRPAPGGYAEATIFRRLGQGLLGVIGVVFAGLTTIAVKGLIPPPATVSLAFPMEDRMFVVGQGGASTLLNPGHRKSESQKHAVDIVAMNVFGRNKSGFGDQPPEAYAIWDAPVVAPCEGRVAWLRDGLEDAIGAQADPATPAGNAVALECGAITVFLAHLREGSLEVERGQRVAVGDPIGRVGNSGNTTEPHLHIHVENGAFDGEASGNQGIAIIFDGNFPTRNDVFIQR